MSGPFLQATVSFWAQFPHMHNKGTNNKMTISKGMSLRTKVTPLIAITLLRSGSAHIKELGKQIFLMEQVWTEESCQEQGQLRVHVNSKTSQQDRRVPEGSKEHS